MSRFHLSDIPCATEGHTLPSRPFSDVLLAGGPALSQAPLAFRQCFGSFFFWFQFDLPTWERKGLGHIRIVGCPEL